MKATFAAMLILALGQLGCGSPDVDDSVVPNEAQATQELVSSPVTPNDWCAGKDSGWYCIDQYRIRGCYNGRITYTLKCTCGCKRMPAGVDDYCIPSC